MITEGIAGTEKQCIALAEALDITPAVKRIKLKFPWKQLSPWLLWGHEYALATGSDSLDPPFPDLIIASGRKSIGLALHIKKQSQNKTFLAQIQDPRLNPKNFDLVIVPQHDPTRGENVIVTKGALNNIASQKLAEQKALFEQSLAHLPSPRVAVLIGGNSKAHTMTSDITLDLCNKLLKLNAGLMITASRRTGAKNHQLLQEKLQKPNIYFWDGQSSNPYFAFLALADYILVTEDSVSMTSEALATGKPVYTIPMAGGAKRLDAFHRMLQEQGYTRRFTGTLEKWSYPSIEDTKLAADEIKRRMKGL